MTYIIWTALLSVFGLGLGFAAKAMERDDKGRVNWQVLGPWFACLAVSILTMFIDPSTLAVAVGGGAGFGLAKAVDAGRFWHRVRRLRKAIGHERTILLETSEEKVCRRHVMAAAGEKRRHLHEILSGDGINTGVNDLLREVDRIVDVMIPAILDHIVEQRVAYDDSQRACVHVLSTEVEVLPPRLIEDANEDMQGFLRRVRTGREATDSLLAFLDKLVTDAHQIRLGSDDNLSDLTRELVRIHQVTDKILEANASVSRVEGAGQDAEPPKKRPRSRTAAAP